MGDSISYIDGVGRIWLHNGVVRLELVAFEGRPDGQQPVSRRTQELAIALPEFVRFCLAMTASLQDMEKQGIIRREAGQSESAQQASGSEVASQATADPAAAAGKRS